MIPLPEQRRKGNGKTLILKGAATNNLKNITAQFPLGKMMGITGVSGSGKSSLITETFVPAVKSKLFRSFRIPEITRFESLEGAEHVDKLIDIDQSPIGRTPKSNPATYTKLFDGIREIFADTPSQRPGYKIEVSFNVREAGAAAKATE